ncbi:armadillo-type protein [Entophlyctis helioformis]|nr:armadillo-type protein [Entophlyctis helioformis]
MSTWQPNVADLGNLVQLFSRATNGTSAVQAELVRQLQMLSTVPDYCNYLAYIFALTNEPVALRTIAGLNLKNTLRDTNAGLEQSVLHYVKAAVFQALADNDSIIRSTSGTIITTVNLIDRRVWPDAIHKLIEAIDSQNPHLVEGAFSALRKICEDSAADLETGDEQLLAYLIHKLLQNVLNENAKVRVAAIESLSQFILSHCPPLFANIDGFVASLYHLTSDTNKSVRKAVCQALVLLFEASPEPLLTELHNVVAFMLYCTQDEEEKVALEACEFWLAFAEHEDMRDHLEPFLPQIIPVLIKSMVYSEDEIAMLGGDEDDANVPDNVQDIKPRHHKTRNHANAHEGAAGAPPKPSGDDDADDDDDYDNDDDDDMDNEWNVRKCSAAAVDVMATVFKSTFLPLLLPLINQQLFNDDWKCREAGILALGAIAEGCSMGMLPHLPQLVPMMINILNDKKPLVRSITCWTLGRYANWIIHGDPTAQNVSEEERRLHMQTYFEPFLQGMLRMTLDNNKRVQETGCSSLAVLEEVAGDLLVPYLAPILQTIAAAFPKYQHKNLLILYDALGTLADAVGPALNNQQLIPIFMPQLTQKWEMLDDSDHGLFPLFECLASISISLGSGFAPFSPVVWSRCLRIISTSLVQYENFTRDPQHFELPDKDFIVVALDLLSGVAQGMAAAVEPLVPTGAPNIIDLLMICLKHPFNEVRQSSCALVGDFAIMAFPQIKARVPEFMQLMIPLIESIQSEDMSTGISNNATWASGEIALKMEREMEPWVQPLMTRLVPILLSSGTKQTLKENAAITIGRLGIANAAMMAPSLEQYGSEWCQALSQLRDNLEKESAFQGFCQIVAANPNGLVNHLVFFCAAIVGWTRISPTLNETFRSILVMYASGLGAQWPAKLSTFPFAVQQRLKERYNV